ncbi:ribosome-inactivating family protein [Micromonospora sp. PLK6-60]|uniref:ribosome-inactivating family protein n=1 Tax=Micromonospora sp. PLK6-60 TaxID=2873383 RepID=UPI002102A4E1|nr:ribosome-inactivating family protein [Micromonospora sp. PLK6-60]
MQPTGREPSALILVRPLSAARVTRSSGGDDSHDRAGGGVILANLFHKTSTRKKVDCAYAQRVRIRTPGITKAGTRRDGAGRMKRVRSAVRAALASALSLLALVAGVNAGAQPAAASMPTDWVAHIHFNLRGQPSDQTMNEYSSFINNLRYATSNWHDGTGGLRTQREAALIRVTLQIDWGERADLWINARDLYVWGFSNGAGTTWAFSNHVTDLQNQLNRTINRRDLDGINTHVNQLYFSGNYTSLRPAAGVSAPEGTTTQWADFRGATLSLSRNTNPTTWNGGNQQTVANSLHQLITAVPEAARFNDIEGLYRSGMRSGSNFPRLGLQNVALTNAWSALSSWMLGRSLGGSSTYNLTVVQGWVIVIASIAHARQYVRVGLGGSGS